MTNPRERKRLVLTPEQLRDVTLKAILDCAADSFEMHLPDNMSDEDLDKSFDVGDELINEIRRAFTTPIEGQ